METVSQTLAGFTLRSIYADDIQQAADLVGRAMNLDEGRYAAETLRLHFESRRLGVDDGRALYVLEDEEKIVGIVGLHFYTWGPPDNVWLSWFAVDPRLHGQGVGARLLQAAITEARRRNHMKMFIETYSTPEFARARAFYEAQGFVEAGSIRSYLPNGGSMVAFYRDITNPS